MNDELEEPMRIVKLGGTRLYIEPDPSRLGHLGVHKCSRFSINRSGGPWRRSCPP